MGGVEYDASLAGEQASLLRIKPRKGLKLVADGALLGVVVDHLKKKWSPEQIAGKLNVMDPDQPSFRSPVKVYADAQESNELLLNMELAKTATKH